MYAFAVICNFAMKSPVFCHPTPDLSFLPTDLHQQSIWNYISFNYRFPFHVALLHVWCLVECQTKIQSHQDTNQTQNPADWVWALLHSTKTFLLTGRSVCLWPSLCVFRNNIFLQIYSVSFNTIKCRGVLGWLPLNGGITLAWQGWSLPICHLNQRVLSA